MMVLLVEGGYDPCLKGLWSVPVPANVVPFCFGMVSWLGYLELQRKVQENHIGILLGDVLWPQFYSFSSTSKESTRRGKGGVGQNRLIQTLTGLNAPYGEPTPPLPRLLCGGPGHL